MPKGSLCDEIPIEDHDKNMDFVTCEEGICKYPLQKLSLLKNLSFRQINRKVIFLSFPMLY